MPTSTAKAKKPKSGKPDLLTVAELAEHFGVTVRAVRHWIKRGLKYDGKRDQKGSGPAAHTFDPEKVLEWMASEGLVKDDLQAAPIIHIDGEEVDPELLEFPEQLEMARKLNHIYSKNLLAAIESGNIAERAAMQRLYAEHGEFLRKLEMAAPKIFEDSGRTIAMDKVVEIFSDVGAEVKADLRALPNKLAPKLAGRSNTRYIRDALAEALDETLLRWSESRLTDNDRAT